MEKNLRCGALRRRSWIVAAVAGLASGGAASSAWAEETGRLAVPAALNTSPSGWSAKAAHWHAEASPQARALYVFARAIQRQPGAIRSALNPREERRQDRVARGAVKHAGEARDLLIVALAEEAKRTRTPSPRQSDKFGNPFHGGATVAVLQRRITVAVQGDTPDPTPIEILDGLADGIRVYLSAFSSDPASTPTAAASGDPQAAERKAHKKPGEPELRAAAVKRARDLMNSHIDMLPFPAIMFPDSVPREQAN